MLQFIDFHTHSLEYGINSNSNLPLSSILNSPAISESDAPSYSRNLLEPTILAIPSLDYSEYLGLTKISSYCAVGLHPWFLGQNININSRLSNSRLEAPHNYDFRHNLDEIMHQLWLIAQNSAVIAIGECGLDRYHANSVNHLYPSIDLESQIMAFAAQIELSESLEKPLIIHCVKAFNELISLKQKHRPRMPWLVHGFDRKDDLRRSLAKHHINVSFGASILNPKSHSALAMAAATEEQLFFETDAQSKFTIMDIYHQAALIRRISLEKLQEQLRRNLCYLFNINFLNLKS
ncbi:MAG: TatD family hydrolase [Pseudanabaena sp. ELA607]|jgi:TatD DNase family protein